MFFVWVIYFTCLKMDIITQSIDGIVILMNVYQVYVLYKKAKVCYDIIKTTYKIGAMTYSFITRRRRVDLLTYVELDALEEEWVII